MSKIVISLESINFINIIPGICEGYIFRRQCRLLFKRSDIVRDLIKLIYSNLLEPIRVLSIIKSRYVLIFIEGKSHFPKYYYLKIKEENIILEKFKEYKAWIKNIIGKRIKILRTDREGEYVN